ncbi:MAG: hypothetical protein JWQ95_1437 [Sphaerisporangium sp.]|jgi:hypothetical protein|nr:hypothetical protein [Sphaerisporangium sp.]
MRRNVLAALVLSSAIVVPATLVTTAHAAAPEARSSIAVLPSDDLIKGGYESLTSCQSALPDIEEQQSSVQTSLVCKAYASSSAEMWGVYNTESTEQEATIPESR